MDSYRSLTYHIVFGTKYRRKAIPEEASSALYGYLWGIFKKNHCHLYRINGIEDHLHIVCDLHPEIALARLIKDLKVASSKWMKESGRFPDFQGWGPGYGAFTYSTVERERIVNYVKNQREHHKGVDFSEELRKLLEEFKIDYDERYLP